MPGARRLATPAPSTRHHGPMATGRPESINAVTLGVADMAASCAFYEALGFEVDHGGPDAEFTTYRVGPTFLNLQSADRVETTWGRFIVHVDDVDAMHRRATEAGLTPTMAPSDAPWGERYFHIDDPDGHEVSFARRLDA
jgi:catechol 2,3-dioxygenase-like lactoylglutathione lyase family enzyme